VVPSHALHWASARSCHCRRSARRCHYYLIDLLDEGGIDLLLEIPGALMYAVDGVLYLNPGRAGPRRFHLPVSMALLHLEPDSIRPELIAIPV
jgi:hypothetical protein